MVDTTSAGSLSGARATKATPSGKCPSASETFACRKLVKDFDQPVSIYLVHLSSKRVERYVEDSGGRIRLHPLPSWSPESNPMELVWWSLHEAVSRNHECSGFDDLVEFAEGNFKERQPFRLKLGEVYEQLERSPP
jgi:hypothetical protein